MGFLSHQLELDTGVLSFAGGPGSFGLMWVLGRKRTREGLDWREAHRHSFFFFFFRHSLDEASGAKRHLCKELVEVIPLARSGFLSPVPEASLSDI